MVFKLYSVKGQNKLFSSLSCHAPWIWGYSWEIKAVNWFHEGALRLYFVIFFAFGKLKVSSSSFSMWKLISGLGVFVISTIRAKNIAVNNDYVRCLPRGKIALSRPHVSDTYNFEVQCIRAVAVIQFLNIEQFSYITTFLIVRPKLLLKSSSDFAPIFTLPFGKRLQ